MGFTLEAYLHDCDATLGTEDWVAGDSLGAFTLLATFASSGWSTAGYDVFTSEAAFPANINKTGTTRLAGAPQTPLGVGVGVRPAPPLAEKGGAGPTAF